MQWGQIKVLFILSFLVLDIFLLNQFMEKQQASELGPIATENSENFEAELESNNITVSWDNVPTEVPSVPQTISSGSEFSEGILSQIQELREGDEQTVAVQNNSVLKSELNEPVEVTEDNVVDQVNSVVPFGNQYEYWNWNKEEGVILFFQKKNDHTIFYNSAGFLMLQVEDGKITNYIATLLSFSDGEEQAPSSGSKETQLIQPRKIIQKLMEEDHLASGDEVTSMSVGYYNSFYLVPGEENGPQVFAPTWKVTVNGEKNLFVYAMTGAVIDEKESAFIEKINSSFNLSVNNTSSPLVDNEKNEEAEEAEGTEETEETEETNNGVSNE
ncbi:Two-component signal transduction system YycFG, regulatory protein YycI [Halobacillus alkaliphilus]|uniref:Two-component signal transduction system YycFG, regulatory protein YycI n=1 Tax=Halobacillus alkaliphilus TaxID=396056 RepID=A0A1I2KIN2_9BACI|nr:two-component system regulatory protein YycI [Halobacillus alkaliphilus]SFF65107.1 Two-component signal transduction system YycFG, regulatory protein YycI [Halobacillus alkaliphilus]